MLQVINESLDGLPISDFARSQMGADKIQVDWIATIPLVLPLAHSKRQPRRHYCQEML
jgi:hypothetical protein